MRAIPVSLFKQVYYNRYNSHVTSLLSSVPPHNHLKYILTLGKTDFVFFFYFYSFLMLCKFMAEQEMCLQAHVVCADRRSSQVEVLQ